jgi:hypothetical protein
MRFSFLLLLLTVSLNGFSQPIDRYFLGLPFRSPNAVSLDKIKSDSRFRPSYKSDYPEWMYFDAEYLDNRAADPDCDSIKIILTSGFGNFINLDRIAVVYYYQNRSIQTDKYDNIEWQLKSEYRNYDYVSEGDLTLNLDKMEGIICRPYSQDFPEVSLFYTTGENSFAVIIEYTKVNDR